MIWVDSDETTLPTAFASRGMAMRETLKRQLKGPDDLNGGSTLPEIGPSF